MIFGEKMASDKNFVDFVLEQLTSMEEISSKKMFGEYGIFLKDKMVAVICDNRFFVKPTDSGKKFLKNWKEDCPYPGAKPYILLEDEVENPELLSELIKITYDSLPEPKKKKKK